MERKKPKDDFYPTAEIEAEVREKGFFVYDYISLRELLLTVKADYLSYHGILIFYVSFCTLLFSLGGIAAFLQSILDPSLFWELLELIGPALFVIFLVSYGFIFVFILLELFERTTYFFLLRNIVFTTKNTILGSKIYSRREKGKLHKDMKEWENSFYEKIGGTSDIHDFILKKRKKIQQGIIGVISFYLGIFKKWEK